MFRALKGLIKRTQIIPHTSPSSVSVQSIQLGEPLTSIDGHWRYWLMHQYPYWEYHKQIADEQLNGYHWYKLMSAIHEPITHKQELDRQRKRKEQWIRRWSI